MKKNVSKALAGALSLAMVLGMAAPAGVTAQAATKGSIKTKYSAIYAGKSKTYTLKKADKTTKWSVTGEGKQYVTLSKKKGAKVTVKVAKDAPAGLKATVVAKLANKDGKYKIVDRDKFTLKVDATAVAVEGNGEVKTGSTATYTAKTTPVKTTNHVYFTVTDKDGKATTGATMNATSGVLTANAAGEYKVNVATARGDKKAAEGKFTATASMDVKVTDPAVPDAKLTSAKQTEAKKVVVTFDSEVKEIKNEDITVVCDADKSSKTVKEITIGEDKKTATIETLVDILDGKTYTVTYKGSTAQFTASDNVVADFGINNTDFQIKKKQELKINVLDKNQVIIKTIDVKNTSETDGNYSVSVTSNDGYFKDDKFVMQTVGKTEEVVATYFTGKYDAAGNQEGKIEKKFTITAVAQADLASKYEYATISDEAPDEWSETKCSLQIPVNEKTFTKLFAKILDVKGIETINGVVNDSDLNITCTSSDDKILLVDSSDDEVVLSGVKAGTAYVQVKQNGVTRLTIPVTVTSARSLTNAVLDGANATISNSTRVGDSEDKTIKLDKHKDQYNKDFNDYEIDKVEVKSYPSQKINGVEVGKVYAYKQIEAEHYSADKKELKFVAYDAPVGTYKYEVTFKDTDTDKKQVRTQTITVKTPNYKKNPTVKIKMDADKDVAVKNKKDVLAADASRTVDVKLGLYYDGVIGIYVNLAGDNVGTRPYTLTKNGSVEKDKITTQAIKGVEDALVTGDAIKFCYNYGKNDEVLFTDKLGTGNYAFKFDLKDPVLSASVVETAAEFKSDVKVSDNDKVLTKTITIKDTQPTLTVTQTKNNVDASNVYDAIDKTCTFKYDGRTYKKADEGKKKGMEFFCTKTKGEGHPTKDIQYYKNGKVYNIVKMNVYVSMPDDDEKVEAGATDYIKFDKSCGFSITVND